MKTKLDTTAHEVVGSQETRNLTIEANGKAFKELISGIYSDKAYAIARETMANCVDSHVQAGIPDTPFEIQVPTILDPSYMVRDFGVSMTHEMVMELYSTLFRSTKDDPNSDESNKFVGKFGLGSKSPFSYTDAFQLTAYLDGEMRIYDIYFNGGVPQIALFARMDTDEPNGVKITFPVDPKDCKDFRRAIVRACEGLPVPPTFIGEQVQLPKREILEAGVNWKRLSSTASGAAEAKQGTVLYPLNFHAVIDCPPELEILFNQPFQFEFPIGQLDVTTSRESLSYDEETSANIIQALQSVQKEMRQEWVDRFKACQTYHEFNVQMDNARKSMNHDLWNFLQLAGVTWRGKKPKSMYTPNTRDILIWSEPVEGSNEPKKVIDRKHRFGDLEFCVISSSMRYYSSPVPRFKHDSFTPSATTHGMVVLLEDMNLRPRYTHHRLEILKHARIFNDKQEVVWVRHSSDPTFALKRLRAACGRIPMVVIHLKDVEYKPEPYARLAGGGINANYRVPLSNSWDNPGAEPLPEEAYFVELCRDDVIGTGAGVRTLNRLRNHLVKIGFEDLPLIGIQKSHAKLIKQNPQWLPLLDTAAEVLPLAINENDMFAVLLDHEYIDPSSLEKIMRLRQLLGDTLFNKAAGGTVIADLLEAMERTEKLKVQSDQASAETYQLLKAIDADEPQIVIDAKKKVKAHVAEIERLNASVESAYALLKYMQIPSALDNHPTIPNLKIAKENRERRLPFYSWLKNSRKTEVEALAA